MDATLIWIRVIDDPKRVSSMRLGSARSVEFLFDKIALLPIAEAGAVECMKVWPPADLQRSHDFELDFSAEDPSGFIQLLEIIREGIVKLGEEQLITYILIAGVLVV